MMPVPVAYQKSGLRETLGNSACALSPSQGTYILHLLAMNNVFPTIHSLAASETLTLTIRSLREMQGHAGIALRRRQPQCFCQLETMKNVDCKIPWVIRLLSQPSKLPWVVTGTFLVVGSGDELRHLLKYPSQPSSSLCSDNRL
jgi:hypothetical protein